MSKMDSEKQSKSLEERFEACKSSFQVFMSEHKDVRKTSSVPVFQANEPDFSGNTVPDPNMHANTHGPSDAPEPVVSGNYVPYPDHHVDIHGDYGGSDSLVVSVGELPSPDEASRSWVGEKQEFLHSDRKFEICEEHQGKKEFWCVSCQVEICSTCFLNKHKACEWMWVNEKCDLLRKKFLSDLESTRESEIATFNRVEAENVQKLQLVEQTVDDLDIFKNQLLEHQRVLSSFKKEYEEKVAQHLSYDQTSPGESSVQEWCDKLKSLSDLEIENIPTVPSNQQLQELLFCEKTDKASKLSLSYEKDYSSFIGVLNHIFGEDEGTISRAALSLKDKETWTVCDALSAAAVVFNLRCTSKRPTNIQLRKIRWKESEMNAFKIYISRSGYGVQLWVTEDDEETDYLTSFFRLYHTPSADSPCSVHMVLKDCFWLPAVNTVERTNIRLDAVLAHSASCPLVQIWGHLGEKTLAKIPAQTITSVGMLLVDENDVILLNRMLYQTAHTINPDDTRPIRNWTKFRDLHICIADTFDAAHWSLTYQLTDSKGQTRQVDRRIFRQSVNYNLHFPAVNHSNIGRVMKIMSLMSFRNEPKSGASLYLPGTTMSADAILGVLRDHCWQTNVHLPKADMPKKGTDKASVKSRFNYFNCSVFWDLDPLHN